ncbi:MAG: hypothetical protein Q8M44_07675, partial [bacterium]|nr:hypothetical protein [bacterium]
EAAKNNTFVLSATNKSDQYSLYLFSIFTETFSILSEFVFAIFSEFVFSIFSEFVFSTNIS